jgi:hypothetical protein
MFEITITVASTIYGDLLVTAEVEHGRYSIGTVTTPTGAPVECSLALLEEIELSIEFEVQCARYDALYFSAYDAELFALHA